MKLFRQKKTVLFEERQTFPLHWQIFIVSIITIIAIVVMVFDTNNFGIYEIGFIASLTLFAAILSTQKTITIVDEEGISLRRCLSFNYRYPFKDIVHAEAASLKESRDKFSAYGYFAASLHILGDDGVLIHHTDGKCSFISSKLQNELASAINSAKSAFEQRMYA